MAPLKTVASLYDSCIENVLLDLKYRGNIAKNNGDLRNFLINMLHGAIRDQLIQSAAADHGRFTVDDVLDFISLLGDSSIKKLNLNKRIFEGRPENFYSILDETGITGLHELTIKVKLSKPEMGDKVVKASPLSGLYRALLKGLASNLRVLVLVNSADNEILRLIGQNAVHLTTLDINSSWSVDDDGISNLLFKSVSNMDKLPWQELDKCEPSAVNLFSFISDSKLNETCRTLTEVKIQDTNTSSISLLLLLMFVKNLKSLGGFLYYRNIGDAILSVCNSEGGPRSVALTELWDTQLPPDKVSKLSRLLPHLSHLYTRVSCLPTTPGLLPPLVHLTADFDFLNSSTPIYNFLPHGGSCLRRLVLIDQTIAVGLDYLAAYCPLLEHISGKFDVSNINNNIVPMLNLKSAKIRITSAQTFLWLMRQADHIEDIEVNLEKENAATVNQRFFDSDVLQQLFDESPKSLKTIKVFKIQMFWFTGYHGLVVSCGGLQIDAAYALCAACDSLNIIGELESWFHVNLQDVHKMAKHIRKSNWDVKLRYKGQLYPES